ncbi:MAG: hypothetical protein ACK5DD_05625 [Cyclobacteriaceae bacterium]
MSARLLHTDLSAQWWSAMAFLGIFFISSFSYAQTPAVPRPDTVIIQRADSLAGAATERIEKATSRADSLIRARQQQADSLLKRANTVQQKIQGRVEKFTAGIAGRQDSLRQRLGNLSVPDSLFLFNRHLRQVDSLKSLTQQRLRSVQARAGQSAEKIQRFTDSLERAYTQKAEEWYARFREKTGGRFGNEELGIAGKMNLQTPAVADQFPDLTGLNLPDLKMDLPGLPDLKGLDGLQLPGLPDANLPGVDVPNLDANAPQLPGTDALNLGGNLPGELQKIGEWQQQGSEVMKEAQQIQQEGLANGEKLPGLLEQQAGQLEEIATITQHQQQIEKIRKMQQEYLDQVEQFRDSAKIEAEAKDRLKNLATEQVEQQSEKLQGAQADLAKYKSKFSEIQSIHTLPRRPPNPLKGKPFRERIVPGLNLQISKRDNYSVDLAPQVFYHLRPRWQAGLGLVYRFNINVDNPAVNAPNELFGGKVFVNYVAFKSWFLRLEEERINYRLLPAASPAANDPEVRLWTNTLLMGIGREFAMNRILSMNTQVLFNALHEHNNPYTTKVVLRIGFNFSLKKDQRRGFIRGLKEAGEMGEE